MRKKNLKVQVAALAVTGVIAATPLSVRAEETGNPAASTEAAPSTEAPDTGTVTPAATGVASTSTASTTTPAAGTGASDPATTAPAAGTGASNPAAPAAPASMAATTAPATSSGASTTTSGTAGSTGAAAASGTTAPAPAAVSSDVIENSDGSISFRESAADPGTTAPNNVGNVVKDDKQGTDIQFSGKFIVFPAENSINATITPENAKKGETLAELPGGFNSVSTFSDIKAEDMIMKGDLSIAKDEASSYDSTKMDAHSVDKEESYSLKADLDVSSVSKALTASEGVGKNIIPSWMSEALGYSTRDLSINDTYVNNLTTGFRTVVQMDNNLNGSFYLPKDLADAKKHYELSSADGNPMIYRINYRNSSFSKGKVSIAI